MRSSKLRGPTICVIEAGGRAKSNCPRGATVVEMGKDIVFDPAILDTYDYKGWRSIHHDLLVVSAAVEYADRSRARCRGKWSRDFEIVVPVIELRNWLRAEVQDSLRSALGHLTGDRWIISFVQWEGSVNVGSGQRSLPTSARKKFVIAYSDGLDSRCVAGLYGADAASCVRVEKNKSLRRKNDEPFDQIPFSVRVGSARESSVRSRGFKFSAITAIVAQLSDLRNIVVPESGQGALGPVLLPLHNVYADYRNHPTYFRKMERLIKAVLEHNVRYEQPRLWNTKAETIAAYRETASSSTDELFRTRSCWQKRWNVKADGEVRQCGLCAACLLRRMSMLAANIDEPDGTYVMEDLTVSQFCDVLPRGSAVRCSRTMLEYGVVGARHLQHLADMAELRDERLEVHAFEIAQAIGAPLGKTLEDLRNMLLTHAMEWRSFIAAQGGRSFMISWTEGGRRWPT